MIGLLARNTGWLLLVTALLLRLLRLKLSPLLSRDGILYLELAQNWAAGQPVAWWNEAISVPPLFLGLWQRLITWHLPAVRSGQVLNIVAGSLCCVVIFHLTQCVTEKRTIAIFAGFLAAFQPFMIDCSIQLQRESLYLLFAMLFLWGCLRLLMLAENEEHLSVRQWLLWGWIINFCGSSAFLCRYESLELLAVELFAMLLCIHPGSRWKEARRSLWFFLGGIAGVAGGLGFWTLLCGIPGAYYLRLFSILSGYSGRFF